MHEGETFTFGRFRLLVDRRELLLGDEPVEIGSRAFDLLLALLRRKGQLASKDELMQEVWPQTVVEENNLQVQMSALRRALGEAARGLRTVSGRGYRFVPPQGEIVGAAVDQEVDAGEAAPGETGSLRLPDKPSVAVLPFTNMSGDPAQDYFADGIVEDITTLLSRFPSLFVIARNSAFIYKGRPINVTQVGRDLGVRYLLEGSVRKAGNRVRITAQLVQANTGNHIWAERYDGELADIFTLQDRIAERVVTATEFQVSAAEIIRARSKARHNLDAYDLYLRALPFVHDWNEVNSAVAEQMLRAAVEKDPDYADALASLAHCIARRVVNGWIDDWARARREPPELARRAVAVDPGNGIALSTAAYAQAAMGDAIEPAMEFARRAAAIQPMSAIVRTHIGWVYNIAGRSDAAIEEFEIANRLNPLDPRAHAMQVGFAAAHFFARRFEQAIAFADRAVAQGPGYPQPRRYKAAALAHLDRLEEARVVIADLLQVQPKATLTRARNAAAAHAWMMDLWIEGLRKAGLPE